MSCRMLPLLFIPLLFILPSCVCGPFVVNVTQSSYQAEENHNVTLEWTFTTNPKRPSYSLGFHCVLLVDDRPINLLYVQDGVQNPEFQDEHFSGRVQWDQDLLRGRVRLHVSRLRTSDSGQYLCEVSTSYGMNSEKCRLNVSGDGPVAIRTWVGEAVILPCRINVSRRQDVPSVEWSKRGPTPNVCFLYRDGCETFEEKNPVFRFRTGLFLEELKYGNVSLRLSDVRLSDAGIYECRRLQGAPRVVAIVELFVGAVSEPRLSVVPGVPVTVQCDAGCWSPLPEVTIEDAHGNAVAGAQESKHVEDSVSGCVNVTRRATVKTDRVVCRVHQSETNLTRLTEIYVPEECTTSCIPMIFVAFFLGLLVPSGCAYLLRLLWKKYKSEGESKSLPKESSNGKTTSSQAEGQNLMSQTDPVQNDTVKLRIEVAELKSSLREKDETIQRQLEELRSKQSPVECQHHQPMYPSQDVSNPTNLTPEPLPRDVDPKPGAASDAIRPKSGNFSQNKDSKPNISRQIPAPAAALALPAEGWSVSRSRSKSDSSPRSNNAKTKPTNNLSRSINRFGPLGDLSEEKEGLLFQQLQEE